MYMEASLSRRNVQIECSNPMMHPRTNLVSFIRQADPTILDAGLKWMDQVSLSQGLQDQVGEQAQP